MGAEWLKSLEFHPLTKEVNKEEEDSIEEDCHDDEVNLEDSDGDIDIEELSDSESLGSVEIEVETSRDASQGRECESFVSCETELKTHDVFKGKFQVGERVLCYEPHFYMIHETKIVSRSKRKGHYWVNFENWSSSKKHVEVNRDLLLKDTPPNQELMKQVNKVKEEDGEGVKFSLGEEVLCYEPDMRNVNKIYQASIVRVLHVSGEPEASYVVHFPGWGNKHNRRVDRSLLLKDTPIHRELMERVNLMMDQRISKKRRTKKRKKISSKQLSRGQTHAQG